MMVSPSHIFIYTKEILLHPNYEVYMNSYNNDTDLIRHSLGNFYRYNGNLTNYPNYGGVPERFNPTSFTLKTEYTFPNSRFKRLFFCLTDQQIQQQITKRILLFLDNYKPKPEPISTPKLIRVVKGVPVYVSPPRRPTLPKPFTWGYTNFPWKYPDRMKNDPFLGVDNK